MIKLVDLRIYVCKNIWIRLKKPIIKTRIKQVIIGIYDLKGLSQPKLIYDFIVMSIW